MIEKFLRQRRRRNNPGQTTDFGGNSMPSLRFRLVEPAGPAHVRRKEYFGMTFQVIDSVKSPQMKTSIFI